MQIGFSFTNYLFALWSSRQRRRLLALPLTGPYPVGLMATFGAGEVDEAIYAALLVQPSLIPNSGDGLFTGGDIPAGAVICEYKGTTYRTTEAMRLENHDYLM